MNNDIICIYYSRTGKTRQVMEEIAQALDCDTFAVSDHAKRSGAIGWLRCGMDAMRKKTRPLEYFTLPRELSEYKLVIIGTPIWAGRCSAVIRSLLLRRGREMQQVAYVLTHNAEEAYRGVFDQMDHCAEQMRIAEVSLRPGSTGYHFWRDRFIKNIADYLTNGTITREGEDADAGETPTDRTPL